MKWFSRKKNYHELLGKEVVDKNTNVRGKLIKIGDQLMIQTKTKLFPYKTNDVNIVRVN